MCKYLQLTVILLLSFLSLQSQELSASDIDALNKKVEELRNELNKKVYGNDFEKQTNVQFAVDTFKIERLLAMKFESDYSTNGMSQAMSDAEAEYDLLLNKYYKLLMSKLNEDDKEVLKQAQRAWIAYRDAERKLRVTITLPQYSGGGTMYNLYVADDYLSITRKRVFELYEMISRFYEYGY